MYYRVSNVSAQMLVILDGVVSDGEEVEEYEYVIYKPQRSGNAIAAIVYIEDDVGAYVDCSDKEEYAVGNSCNYLCVGEELMFMYMLNYLGNEV